MYRDAEEMLNNELPINIRARLFKYFDNAESIISELLSERTDLFDSKFINNIRGYMWSFLINRQFELMALNDKSIFQISIKGINSFGRNVIEIRYSDIILYIGKTMKKNQLPNKANYKLEKSRLNTFEHKQTIFDYANDMELKNKEEPYFGFLTFSLKNNKISHLQIVIPDKFMNRILCEKDLLNEIHTLENFDFEEKEEENLLVNLKEELVEQIVKLKTNN